jgi:hypothetical protein
MIGPYNSQRIIVIKGTQIIAFDPQNGVGSTTGSLDSAPTSTSAVTRGESQVIYYTDAADDDSYKVSVATGLPVLTKYVNSPGGGAIALYGDRLVVGGRTAASTPNILYYSAAGDFTTWPALNTLAVGGDTSPITGLYTQRTQLLIAKPEGFFVLSGVPGVNETLRRVTSSPGPTWQRDGDTLGANGQLLFVPNDQSCLASFDGSYDRLLDNYFAEGFGSMSYIMRERDAIIYLTSSILGLKMWVYYRNCWTQHTFGSSVATDLQFVTSASRTIPTLTSDDQPTTIAFANDAGTSQVYLWSLGQDSPGSTTLAIPGNNLPGDNSLAQLTGNFSLPEWHSDEGSEVVVRGVIVDFRDWNTGGTLSNHFDCRVDSYRNYDNSSPIVSHTESWDGIGTQSSTEGTVRRKFISMGDQGGGNGFQIHFTNCRGVAFRRIEVIIESSSVRL